MAWAGELVRRIWRRRRSESGPATLLDVVRAIAVGSEQETEAAARSWAAAARAAQEEREAREEYIEAARAFAERVKKCPGRCFMPGIDE